MSTSNDAMKASQAKDLSLLARLLPYLWARPWLFISALVLYPVVAMVAVLPPIFARQIIDVALPAGAWVMRWDPRPIGLEAFYLRPNAMLWWLAVAYGATVVFEYIVGFISQYAMSVVGLEALKQLRQDLFKKVQRLPAQFFDHQPIGKVLTRLTNDVEALIEVFSTGTVTAVADIVKIVIVISLMLSMNVRLTLLSLLVTPILIGVSWVFRRYAREAFRRIRKSLSDLNTFLAEHIRGMAVVQLFRQQDQTFQTFSALNRQYRDANQDAIRFDALLFAIVQALSVVTVAALLYGGADALADGSLKVGLLVAFVGYTRRIFEPIRDLAQKFTMLQQALAAAERVFGLLGASEVIHTPPKAKALQQIRKGLVFDDVWFRYPAVGDKENPWILKGLDLEIRKGEQVALVGSTGSGKSTILRLLNRSYDITQGQLTIDDVPIAHYDLKDLRKRFGYVLQDVFLFEGTFESNVSLLSQVAHHKVQQAVQAVGIDDILTKHGGYQAEIVARGQNMSVGERQLVSFARALAYDPEVLVLDEATSHIDSETEAKIQKALEAVTKDRTALMVAHRLSTIQKADKIVVLEGGKVSQQGDHDSLMAQGGFYAELVDLQHHAHATQRSG